MAKNLPSPIIPPYKCTQALTEYHQRITMLLNVLPSVFDYVRENLSGNKEHQERLLSIALENYDRVKEFHNVE